MERPLAAAPGAAFMDRTAGVPIIKNTVVVNDLHLHHVAGYPPVFFPDLFTTQAQLVDHPLLILLVQGNGSFALAAVTAAATDKYIGKKRSFFRCCILFIHFDPGNNKNAPAMK